MKPVDTVFVETVTYRDTTITVTLPGATLIDSIFVALPCPPPPGPPDTAKVRNEFANAKAWLAGRQLKINLTLDARQLKLTIDSAVENHAKIVTITQTQTVKVKVVPFFFKLTAALAGIFLLLLLFIIFLALRR